MKKKTTVLFDFDGTVMDTNKVIINSWQHTFRSLEGKERNVEDIVKTFGEPLSTTMEKFFPNIPVEKSINIYRSYHYENFSSLIKVFPGIVELLEELKEKKYKIGLVTSRLKPTTMEGLEKYDLIKYFDAVVTMEDCTKHKPNPEPINIALKKLKSTATESVMVGDTMFDIMCAKNAGVESVLVSWALAVSDEEKEGINGPDYYVERASDILDVV